MHELVQGDDARVIGSFPLTGENYTHSVNLLKGQYGQSYKIINAHMDALLNLRKPSNSLSSLQAFHDTIEQHMRALTSLGKAPESYGAMLAPSVLSKFPVETKEHIAHNHHDSEWSIKDIMSGLLKEIQILDISQQYSGKPSIHDSLPQPHFTHMQIRGPTAVIVIRENNQHVHSARVITRPTIVM